MTGSIQKAVSETERRRKLQKEYNIKHNITPRTIVKDIRDNLDLSHDAKEAEIEDIVNSTEILEEKKIRILEQQMKEAAAALEFEVAAALRDKIKELKGEK
jgi:excinuclease ABC subunit B